MKTHVFLTICCGWLLFPARGVADGASAQAPQMASADGREIAFRTDLDFEPLSAELLFVNPKGIGRAPALIVPLPGDNVVPGNTRSWAFGSKVPAGADPEQDEIFALVSDSSGTRSALYLRAGVEPLRKESLDSWRSEVKRKREIFSNYQSQLAEQERTLKRLRNDVDLIGNLGDVSDMRDDVRMINDSIAARDRDIARNQDALKQIKQIPEPQNLTRREGDLSKQLTELAAAAKQAESGEQVRREQGVVQAAEENDLLERANSSDPTTLRAELVKLRRRREELEQSVEARAGSPVDYE